MGAPFDFAPERPEHIQQILDGLDRYNPETTQVFQDYVMQQCESQTYDCYANLALLKLYVYPSTNLCRHTTRPVWFSRDEELYHVYLRGSGA